MKKILLTLQFLSITLSAFSQNFFLKRYSTQPGSATSYPAGIYDMARCIDNTYAGITNDTTTAFNLFRMDSMGTILWWKRILSPGNNVIVPYQLLELDDSSLVVTASVINMPFVNIICRTDHDGNLLQTVGLGNPTGTIYPIIKKAGPHQIILLGGSHYITMDTTLTVLSAGQVAVGSGNTFLMHDAVQSAPNEVRIAGFARSPGFVYLHKGVCSFNYLANIFTGYSEINYPDSLNGNSVQSRSTLIVKSAANTYYNCASTLDGRFTVVHSNNAGQVLWAKKLTPAAGNLVELFNLSAVDSGLLSVTRNFIQSPLQSYNPVLKFDFNGNLEWTRKTGNSAITGWNFTSIGSPCQTENGWLMPFSRQGDQLGVWKTDSMFNTVCYNESFAPAITDFSATTTPYPITVLNETITTTTLSLTTTVDTFYSTDVCIPSAVSDPAYNVSPEPIKVKYDAGAGILTVHAKEQTTCSVEILDVSGRSIMRARNITFLGGSVEFSLQDLSKGVYIVSLFSTRGGVSEKFAIE